MKNTTVNMTEGNPVRHLIVFSIPMLIGNIFQQLYNIVDSIVVGRFVGANALGSVGVSNATLQSLAQGINYLGTGNITGLAGNESLQRLMIAGAQAAGLPYGSMLTGGITSDNANQLLQGIVEVMQNIASTSNQVVKSQYASLSNLTVSPK